tara:strand:+ start:132 stop:437 length:306 start_codon:yes stop_codon:yes gene_type:complete
MVKDHFYYCLRDRLEFAREYAHDCATRLRHTEINKKADYDFFRNNKILFIFEEILNLPTNICRAYKIARMKISLKKCLSDIKVMQQELNNYESNNQENNKC